MSETSYELNLRRGVTGPCTETCFLASFDRISPVTGIKTQTYERYSKLREMYVRATNDNHPIFVPDDIAKEFRQIQSQVKTELGLDPSKDLLGYRANTAEDLRLRLASLAIGGFRTAVYLDTGGLHAVGVVRQANEDDYYAVRSTWSPFVDEDAVHVNEIFEWLDKSPRIRARENSSRRTVKAINIAALPPEPSNSQPTHNRL